MARTVNHFVNTSADDCRCSLQHTTVEDLPVLRQALQKCATLRYSKTKYQLISRRITKLEKEAAHGNP